MKTNWREAFRDAHLGSWPPEAPVGLAIAATKPKHESSRNLFKEDREEILKAAAEFGFKMVTPPGESGRVVSFVKPRQKTLAPQKPAP